MRILRLIFCFLFLSIFLKASTYYVDDVATNGTGTFANPFNNFNSVMVLVQPGDSVLVMPGIYTNNPIETFNAGTFSQRIVIQAFDPNNRPIIQRNGRCVTLQNSRPYYTLDGFLFDGQFGNDRVVRIHYGNDGVILRNCEIKNALKNGVDISNCDSVLFENLEIHHMLGGSLSNPIDAHGIAAAEQRNLTVRNCEIYYVSGDCFQSDPDRGPNLWDDILIEDCKFWTGPLPADAAGWNAGEIPGENAIDTKINRDSVNTSYFPKLTLRNIEAYGFRDGGISDPAAFLLKEKLDCEMTNIKVYDNKNAFRIRGTWGSAHLTLINCIAFNNTRVFRTEDNVKLLHIYNGTFNKAPASVYFQHVAGGVDTSGFEVRNSLFVIGTKPWEASDSSNLAADSSFFIDALNNDYHLAANSPAIDAGVDIPEVVEDFEGNPRVIGSYDVGAYEFGNQNTNNAPLLNPVADHTMDEDTTLNVPVTAIDPDTDNITLSVNNLPAFGSFTDNGDGTGMISFAPLAGDSGVYQNIEIVATDDGIPPLSNSTDFTLTVLKPCTQGFLGNITTADTLVNSTDALIILSYDAGLPIPPDIQNLINIGFGDVIEDGITNSTDALIIISYDVGIPVPFPVGDPVCLPDNGSRVQRITTAVPKNGERIIVSAVPANTHITRGTTIEVPITVDLSNLAEKLGSFTSTLEWDATALEFVGYRGGTSLGFENPVVNDGLVENSKLIFANAYPYGADNIVNILNVQFKVTAEVVSVKDLISNNSLSLRFSAMAAAKTFNDLLPYLDVEDTDMELIGKEAPATYEIENYPNPFNPTTTIEFALPQSGFVSIKVYNTLGQEVAILVSEKLSAGKFKYDWDAGNLASGFYFYQLQIDSYIKTKKMLLLR